MQNLTENSARHSGKPILFKVLIAAVTAAALLVGVIGLMHTAPFRNHLPPTSVGCPVKHGAADIKVLERARHAALTAATKNTNPSPALPALGLALNTLTIDASETWAKAHGLQCTRSTRGYVLLECTDVPPEALGQDFANRSSDYLALAFGSDGALLGVTNKRMQLTIDQAITISKGVVAQLSSTLGPPTDTTGELTPEAMQATPLAMTTVNYRFANYCANVTTSNVPWAGGRTVTETYQAIRHAQ